MLVYLVYIKGYGMNKGQTYKESLLVIMCYPFLKTLLGPLIQKIWIKEVSGVENIPLNGQAIVASNHESYLDFICFMAICPRKVHYIAAEKFYNSLLWRPLMYLTGQIKLDRSRPGKSTFKIVLSALQCGKVIGIFPEGTRSNGKLLAALPGCAWLALKAGIPVIPVGVSGTFEIMPRHAKIPKFKKKVKIKIGKPLLFTQYHAVKHSATDLEAITAEIMSEITRLKEDE